MFLRDLLHPLLPPPLPSSYKSQVIFDILSVQFKGLELCLTVASQLKKANFQHCIFLSRQLFVFIFTGKHILFGKSVFCFLIFEISI